MKQGMILDRVVLVGRTLEEYQQCFALDLEALRGQAVLDVASGVSSFCVEAREAGLNVTAFDAIYELSADEIQSRCAADLDHVVEAVRDLKTYRWDFYKSPENLHAIRGRAYKTFLADYRKNKTGHYVSGRLPKLPFREDEFDLTLASYLLFVYADQLDYDFHKQTIKEIMRVTRGEARLYPIVTFETKRCSYIDRLRSDSELSHLGFEEIRTDFEFLLNSNCYLRVFRR